MLSKKQLLKVILLTIFIGPLFSNAKADDLSHYSNLYFFGDSLTDSGSIGWQRFTTKPGLVWSEDLGIAYNKAVAPAYITPLTLPNKLNFTLNNNGNNFAVSGALINSPNPGDALPNVNLPSVNIQVNDFLARGPIDPSALYSIWAGANDLIYQFNASGGSIPSSEQYAAMINAAMIYLH